MLCTVQISIFWKVQVSSREQTVPKGEVEQSRPNSMELWGKDWRLWNYEGSHVTSYPISPREIKMPTSSIFYRTYFDTDEGWLFVLRPVFPDSLYRFWEVKFIVSETSGRGTYFSLWTEPLQFSCFLSFLRVYTEIWRLVQLEMTGGIIGGEKLDKLMALSETVW